jgi:hypothetical protein
LYIIGGIVGAIVLLGIIGTAITICMLCRRRSRRRAQDAAFASQQQQQQQQFGQPQYNPQQFGQQQYGQQQYGQQQKEPSQVIAPYYAPAAPPVQEQQWNGVLPGTPAMGNASPLPTKAPIVSMGSPMSTPAFSPISPARTPAPMMKDPAAFMAPDPHFNAFELDSYNVQTQSAVGPAPVELEAVPSRPTTAQGVKEGVHKVDEASSPERQR